VEKVMLVIRALALRLGHLIIVFFMVAALAFLLLHAAPGDPARLQAGIYATPSQIAATRIELGLNRPIFAQFATWVGHALTGNLGVAYTDSQPVRTVIAESLGPTVQLAAVAFALIVIIALPLGVISAVRKDRAADRAGRVLTIFGLAVPNYVIGLLLVLIFGWWVPGIFPFQGYISIVGDPVAGFEHTILPAVALALTPIGLVARLTRTSILEVMNEPYVTAARAFGVSEREVIWRDVLRNGLMPVVTVLGLVFGFLLSGAVIVENIFGIPGLGRQLIQSFAARDYPVAIGVMLVFAAGFLIMSFLADVAYMVVNPRLRRAASGSER
jgi:peptide/nickel transport system permease protein